MNFLLEKLRFLNQYAAPDKLFIKYFQLLNKLYNLDQIIRKKTMSDPWGPIQYEDGVLQSTKSHYKDRGSLKTTLSFLW